MPATKFTQELFDTICSEIATSANGLDKVCKNNGLSSRTFYEWIAADEQLAQTYVRAREAQGELLADQIVEIADDSSDDIMIDGFGNKIENREFVSRSRLRVDARKWIAAKLLPKKYGDKVELSGDKDNPIAVQITGMKII